MTIELRVTAWRDYDDRALATVPALALGTRTVTGLCQDAAAGLVEAGALRVRLHQRVDGRRSGSLRALLLVRELTRRGVVVDWDLDLDPADHDWRELSHLYPPGSLTGGGDGLSRWQGGFFLNKFVIRHGPGFVEVRDWRWSRCQVTRITVAAQVALVGWLAEHTVPAVGAPVAAQALEDMRLLQRIGDLLWLPAFRVWRWPNPAELV
jgi:hypothetical protein